MTRPTTKRVKLSESENRDRLSDLPESLILHILSFLKSTEAVQICVLSQRYKDLWKHLPTLILHSSDFPTYELFNKFLSLRNSSIPLQSLDFIETDVMLNTGRMGEQIVLKKGRQILKRSVNYAISHKVQRLRVKLCVDGHIAQIPSRRLLGSNVSSLKHVDIDARVYPHDRSLHVLNWLSELANIKSLMISQTILQALLLVRLKVKLPSLHNLKSLKVKLKEPSYEVLIRLMEAMLQKAKSKGEANSIQKAFKARLESSSIIYDGIVDLQQNFPLAKVDFIECSRQLLT
ncbi:F-box/FBD/LRR-repeat protein [Trifolium repens]|nr:F-box/FBD/LRR-repeat protein [Trifolium repens]